MNEKELLKALEEDARRECASIIENAQKEADSIIKSASEELENLKKERLLQAKASLEIERIRRLAEARLRANEIILRERQLAITKVLDAAAKRLKEARSDKDYPDMLKRLFAEAFEEWRAKMAGNEKTRAKVIVSRQDASILNGVNGKNGYDIVIDETGDLPPGIIIASEDKRFKVVNTVQSRLEKARPELVSMIDRALFS